MRRDKLCKNKSLRNSSVKALVLRALERYGSVIFPHSMRQRNFRLKLIAEPILCKIIFVYATLCDEKKAREKKTK